MKKGYVLFFVLLFGMSLIAFAGDERNNNDVATKKAESVSENELNVLFISSNIQNANKIAEATKEYGVVVVYDFEDANLRTINLTLEELIEWKKQKIDHLSFFCHGAPGSILLSANELVDLKSVTQNMDEWKAMGKLFSANATLDIYGCEIGWGEAGEKFVKAISYLTGVTVRASDNASGNIHDADWDLEVKAGTNARSVLLNFSQLIKTPVYF